MLDILHQPQSISAKNNMHQLKLLSQMYVHY